MDDLTRDDQNSFASGFLLGLVVGGAGGYYFTTEKGRALLKKLSAEGADKLSELISQLPPLEGKAEEVVESVKDKLNIKKPSRYRRLFHSGGSPLKS